MDSGNWDVLPNHILVNVFSCLSLQDRYNASQTCQSWSFAFSSPHLWKHVTFCFETLEDTQHLKFVDKFGKYIRSLQVHVNQELEECRKCACRLIRYLSEISERCLQKFKIKFTAQNPFLYSGQEFTDVLMLLFGAPTDNDATWKSLKTVDLREFLVSFGGELLEVLAANNPDLESLNIQNNVLICEVPPYSLLFLVQRCRKLRELRVFSLSCTEDVLLAFTESDREPLQYLSLFCRREEKYVRDIPSSVWKKLVEKLKRLRVTLAFDHTCPLLKIAEVMKPEIPVAELRLETATDLWNEVRLARSYYKTTLEKLIVKSPPSRNSRELDLALLEVAQECPKLRSLHVLYVLEKDTVDKILSLCPYMQEHGTYTLKYVAEPHPWKPGMDFW